MHGVCNMRAYSDWTVWIKTQNLSYLWELNWLDPLSARVSFEICSCGSFSEPFLILGLFYGVAGHCLVERVVKLHEYIKTFVFQKNKNIFATTMIVVQ